MMLSHVFILLLYIYFNGETLAPKGEFQKFEVTFKLKL